MWRGDGERQRLWLAAMVDASRDAIIGTSADGIILSCNRAAERLSGYAADELVGRPLAILAVPERAAAVAQLFERIKAGEFVDDHATVGVRKNGQRVAVSIGVSQVRADSSEVIGAVVIVRDVSERVDLDRLRRLHQMILHSAGDGIYGQDRQARAIFVNPAAERMLGWDPGELIGRDMHALTHHSHADGRAFARHECPINASMADGSVHHVSGQVFWRKDGSTLQVEYTSTPLREDDEIIGTVVRFRNASPERATAQDSGALLARLTPRERDVLRLLGNGQTNAEIGRSLGLRPTTVKDYVEHLLAKLGVANRTQAALLARGPSRDDA